MGGSALTSGFIETEANWRPSVAQDHRGVVGHRDAHSGRFKASVNGRARHNAATGDSPLRPWAPAAVGLLDWRWVGGCGGPPAAIYDQRGGWSSHPISAGLRETVPMW